MVLFARSFGLGLLLAGIAVAGWQPIDSVTSRDSSDISTQSNARSVASDAAGNVHVVWRGRVGGVWQPWYSYRDASTGEWSADTVLRTVPGGVCDPTCVVGPDQSFYVGWNDSATGTLHLLRRDMAGSWLELDSLSGQQGDGMLSLCADESGTIHAVWQRSDLTSAIVCHSSCGAAGWGSPETLTAAGSLVGWPSVASGHGDTVMAVWVGAFAQSIVCRVRAAGSWLGPEVVYSGDVASPCVTWGADSFYVAWLSGGTTKHVLVRAQSGSAWSDTTKLNMWRVEQPGVSVAADGDGALHVAWLGLDSAGHSYPTAQYRHRPAGDTWHTQQSLDAGTGDRQRASVSVLQGQLQVAWSYYPTFGGVPAVRLRRYEPRHDAGVAQIVRPAGTVDSGAVVQPMALAKNYGDLPENDVPVSLRFGAYQDQEFVPTLAPGETDSVVFDTFTANVRGWNVDACSTGLASDADRSNDATRDSFFVRVRDITADSILDPDDTVLDTLLIPRVRVRNRGNVTVDAAVRAWIGGAAYHDSVAIQLGPSGDSVVTLEPWRTDPGMYVLRCSVACVQDQCPENDTLSKGFRVVVSDVGATSIMAPTDTVDSNQSVAPRAAVRNLGTTPATFDVLLRIGTLYTDTARVNVLQPDSSTSVPFDTWRPRESGVLAVRCSTMLAGDHNSTNDAAAESVFVRVRDAAPVAILCPGGVVPAGQVQPRVRVANRGNEAMTFPVRFRILKDSLSVYLESLTVSLSPGATADTGFPAWYALSGTYVAACSTGLAGDMRPDNDTLSSGFRVESLENSRWRELASVPPGSWRRGVRDGGCLVAVEDGLLALKGANTREFYRYSVTMDSWRALASMPAGDSGHRVKAGSALCWDGGPTVFALKGTRTHEFWRYDIPGDSWLALAALPEHTRSAKCGTGLVFVPVHDTDKVFMVKGGNTREFLVYRVRQNEWHARRSLPLGPDSSPARHGTCLALLGGRIFCLKGGTTEFYEYFPGGDSWSQRAHLPLLGRGNRHQKPAKGAALASDGSRFLYAFKGGPGREFWRYDALADSWTQLDDIPPGGRRRKVGRGGALAWFDGRVYAMKGGGSREFWSFNPFGALAADSHPAREAVAEPGVVPLSASRVTPGLLHCGHTSACRVPGSATTVLVFDASGRVVERSAATRPVTELHFSRPGVYFVMTAGDSGSSTAKTIVVR